MDAPETLKTAYDRDGFVRAAGCLPRAFVDDCLGEVRAVVEQIARRQGIDVSGAATTDEAFNALCDADRAFGGMVYDCMRFHPLIQRLASHPAIVETAAALLEAKLCFHVHDQVQFRIDRRDEERFHLDWHQDYWFNNSTSHAVTAWIPLVDVPLAKGPVRFIPGSHREALQVRADPNMHAKWDQNALFKVADPIAFDAGEDVPADAGDVVFLHALSVHRSGLNQTAQNRFTVLVRFSDLMHEELMAKRWKTGLRVGWASLIAQRPDLIRNYDELIETGAVLA
jgi:hypothetical protein